MQTRMKVFLSTMWDLYFFWRFDCNLKMTAGEFSEEIKKHLSFLFNENEEMPNLKDAIIELYQNMFIIKEYYQSDDKNKFVEKFSNLYSK